MNIHPNSIPADIPPDYMNPAERSRVRQAANHALRLYPGPPGKVLSRELWAWDELGWRFGGHTLVTALVDHIFEKVEAAA